MNLNKKKSILVVCMGNICRSPSAEVVLRAKAKACGIEVEVDSAGTLDYHRGEAPDERARRAGERRGYCFDGMTARQVIAEDFEYFDLILAADRDNLADLKRRCPKVYQSKLSLFLSYSQQTAYDEIPDPYYGGENGFEMVLDLLEDAAESLLKQL